METEATNGPVVEGRRSGEIRCRQGPGLSKGHGVRGFLGHSLLASDYSPTETDLGASRVFSSMIVLMQFGRLYTSLKTRIRKSLTV